jgi:mRNA interferase RelE/StbE
MPYRIEVTPAARRDLKNMPKRELRPIDSAIRRLAGEPRPQQAEKLKDKRETFWRLRVGNWRIIYQIEDDRLIVLIVRVGNRKDIYRKDL